MECFSWSSPRTTSEGFDVLGDKKLGISWCCFTLYLSCVTSIVSICHTSNGTISTFSHFHAFTPTTDTIYLLTDLSLPLSAHTQCTLSRSFVRTPSTQPRRAFAATADRNDMKIVSKDHSILMLNQTAISIAICHAMEYPF